MDVKTIIDKLRLHNRWRIGEGHSQPVDARTLTETIDAACDELERISEPAASHTSIGHENGAERLCRILYGRGAEIGDTIGGPDAKMLRDAAAELERLRKAVLPEDD